MQQHGWTSETTKWQKPDTKDHVFDYPAYMKYPE